MLIAFLDYLLGLIKVDIVVLTSRYCGHGGEAECQALHAVSRLGGFFGAVTVKDLRQNFLQLFLGLDVIVVRKIVRQDFVEEDAAQRGVVNLALGANPNRALQVKPAHVVSQLSVAAISKDSAMLGLDARLFVGQVVVTEHDILADTKHWTAIGWLKQVVNSAHQLASFSLSVVGQRQVDSHLVAVKVGIEAGAN